VLFQVASGGRREVEMFGWSAATHTLRQSQYARAVRLSRNKRRFGWLALRVGVAQLFRRLVGWVAALITTLVRALDYARPYRPAAATAASRR
jgi:hypothetical protein